MPRRASFWPPVAVALAVALLLGGLEAVSLHVGMGRLGRPMSWPRAALITMPSWLVYAVLAWPVRLLARAARLGPGVWARRLPVHLLGLAVFVLAAVHGTAFVHSRLGLLGGEPVSAAAVRYFYTYLAYLVVIYGTMVGTFHAYDYWRESELREREGLRLATSLSEARLHALRSQLGPHFFFNTLNAISTFALQGRPEQVGEMVASLGDLVRASLDESLPHEIPLAHELELLDLYLAIERVRFSDWLRVEQEVDPRALDVRVPSLILQPLVENAIEHGAPGRDGISRVRIRYALDGESLVIEVENRDAAASRAAPRLGVGLANTRARLAQLYPDEHQIRFGPDEASGFVVSVRIPARRAPAGEPRAAVAAGPRLPAAAPAPEART